MILICNIKTHLNIEWTLAEIHPPTLGGKSGRKGVKGVKGAKGVKGVKGTKGVKGVKIGVKGVNFDAFLRIS
jgi:hypothetical protein